MKTGTIILLAILCVGVTGCAPSLKSLTEMREIQGDRQAVAQQEALLEQFLEGGQPAAWRAEAMNTMAHLDAEFMHGLHHPKLHGRLVEALRAEYLKPKAVPEITAKDRYQLRAWSINAISRLDQPFFLDFYANILSDRRATNDPGYLLRLAAMNGVLREKKQLLISTDLRQRIFSACATIKSEIRYKTKFNPVAAQLGNAITQLETNLLSYKDAVSMLPHKTSAYTDEGQFLQLLRWCERGIVEEKAATAYPELYEENIRKLLVLIDQPHLKSRTRVRSMLVQYAPLKMLSALVEKTNDSKKFQQPDLELALRLLEVLDQRAGQLSDEEKKGYATNRLSIIEQFFDKITAHDLQIRDYVLGRLLTIDPDAFINLMYQHRNTLSNDKLSPSLLYLRYLSHAYRLRGSTTGDSSSKLIDTVCKWAGSEYLPARRTVTAILLKPQPERLVYEMTPLFDNLKDWDHAATDELVDSYIASLLEIEKKPGRLPLFAKGYQEKMKQDPNVPLTKAIGLRVLPSNKKLADFLADRAPDHFLLALSKAMTDKPNPQRGHRLEELVLLGDIAMAKENVISKDCRGAVVNTLKKHMVPGDADQSLLCLRYILALNGSLDSTFIKRHSAAVRTLYELSEGGQK